VLNGAAPFVAIHSLGIVDFRIPNHFIALVLGFAGLALSSELGQWWTLLRSIKSETTTFSRVELMWNAFYLSVPYLWTLLCGLIGCMLAVYSGHVVNWGAPSNEASNMHYNTGNLWGALKEMRSSSSAVFDHLPNSLTVARISDIATTVTIFTHSIHVIIALVYKRTIASLKSKTS
jgi:hypothetical protein